MATGSSSKLSLWRRCKRKGYYHDVLKLKRNRISIAPARGTIIHACLQNYYNDKDWTIPIQELKIDWDKLFEEEREEWGNLPDELYRIVKGYIRAYREKDTKIKTLATEVQFEMPLGKHTYKGTIDWIFQDEQGIWVADHKTVKRIPDINLLYMDLQTSMYVKAVREGYVNVKLPEGVPVMGVVFNHIKTKPPSKPRILKDGSVSKAACDTDIATYFETVRQQGLDPNDYKDMIDKLKDNVFYRRARLPIPQKTLNIITEEVIATLDDIDLAMSQASNSNRFPRTLLKTNCPWDCEYSQLCFGELAGMNVEGIINEYYEEREDRYDDEDYE